MLPRVHIQEKIREGTFKTRTPTLVNREASTRYFGSREEIQNSRALANFPVRLRGKIEPRCSPPSAHLDVFRGTVPYRDTEMRHVGNREQQGALRRVKLRNPLVRCLDSF